MIYDYTLSFYKRNKWAIDIFWNPEATRNCYLQMCMKLIRLSIHVIPNILFRVTDKYKYRNKNTSMAFQLVFAVYSHWTFPFLRLSA